MCHTADNSLESNLAAQAEMLRRGIVTLDRMPRLRADAENAERYYQKLMGSSGLTPEQLYQLTCYKINVSPDPLQRT